MDVDEFMAFLETRPGKEHWELIEGVAVLMILVLGGINCLGIAFGGRVQFVLTLDSPRFA